MGRSHGDKARAEDSSCWHGMHMAYGPYLACLSDESCSASRLASLLASLAALLSASSLAPSSPCSRLTCRSSSASLLCFSTTSLFCLSSSCRLARFSSTSTRSDSASSCAPPSRAAALSTSLFCLAS